jgi:hypothetical protein
VTMDSLSPTTVFPLLAEDHDSSVSVACEMARVPLFQREQTSGASISSALARENRPSARPVSRCYILALSSYVCSLCRASTSFRPCRSTLTTMPVVSKDLTVYFYVLEPFPERTFEVRAYPLDRVAQTIRALDPAAPDYRIRDRLFGGELFCLFHDDGPEPILGAYYKDTLAKALTECKGIVKELELDDGEGLVDAAYAAFFPDDVTVRLMDTKRVGPRVATEALFDAYEHERASIEAAAKRWWSTRDAGVTGSH